MEAARGDAGWRPALAEVARPGGVDEAVRVDDDAERLRRLTARTFRWNESNDTSGYHAAAIDRDVVRWSRWSHLHGEGHREIGAQTREELERDGPLVAVPSIVLAQILDALRDAARR